MQRTTRRFFTFLGLLPLAGLGVVAAFDTAGSPSVPVPLYKALRSWPAAEVSMACNSDLAFLGRVASSTSVERPIAVGRSQIMVPETEVTFDVEYWAWGGSGPTHTITIPGRGYSNPADFPRPVVGLRYFISEGYTTGRPTGKILAGVFEVDHHVRLPPPTRLDELRDDAVKEHCQPPRSTRHVR